MNMKHVRAALIGSAAIAFASPASADHSWGGYHWAGDGVDLRLKVNTATTSVWERSVAGSIADWEKSTELSLTRQSPGAVSTRKCSPIAGQILVCNDTYGLRGWLGIASIWLSNNHISQATTKLNDSYFNTATYNKDEWRELVACQEVGHDFGLAHQDETFDNYNLGTCMDYTNAPSGGTLNGFNYGPSNRHPNPDDYAELSTIYGHNDGFSSAAASTNFGIRQVGKAVPQGLSAEGSGDGPAQWGRAIHRDARGRPDVFKKDLGVGRSVVTHVFWTPDATGHEAD